MWQRTRLKAPPLLTPLVLSHHHTHLQLKCFLLTSFCTLLRQDHFTVCFVDLWYLRHIDPPVWPAWSAHFACLNQMTYHRGGGDISTEKLWHIWVHYNNETVTCSLAKIPKTKYVCNACLTKLVVMSSYIFSFFRDSVWYRLMVTDQVFLYLWTNTTLMALKTDNVSYWVVVDSQESSSYESDLLLSATVSLSSDNCSHHTLHNGTKDGRRWVGRTPWVTAWRLT